MNKAPGICPHCGEIVPADAVLCPSCGSDGKTGWSDLCDADNGALDGEEYDDAVRRTFGNGGSGGRHGLKTIIYGIAALGMIILFILYSSIL